MGATNNYILQYGEKKFLSNSDMEKICMRLNCSQQESTGLWIWTHQFENIQEETCKKHFPMRSKLDHHVIQKWWLEEGLGGAKKEAKKWWPNVLEPVSSVRRNRGGIEIVMMVRAPAQVNHAKFYPEAFTALSAPRSLWVYYLFIQIGGRLSFDDQLQNSRKSGILLPRNKAYDK